MQAGALELLLFANVARLQKDMNEAKGIVTGATSTMEKAVTSVKNVLGTLGVGLSVGMIVNKFQEVAMQTDKLRGNLVTMTGSTDAAGAAFDSLTKFAAKTPFTLDQSVQAFIKLKALGLDPSERALMSYGNTAAAMGKDMMQMIEAVADASTGEFERLKEFGIKAKQEGDNVTLTFQGVSTTIAKESGAIQEYLLAIGENKFGDAMANQMERLPGLASNLEDSIDGLFRTMADSGGTSIFGAGLKTATSAVTGLTNNLDTIGEAAKILAAILATRLVVSLGYASAGFIANTAQSIAYQAQLARMAGLSTSAALATTGLATAKTGLNAAMMLVGGPAGAILLIVAGLALMVSKMESAQESTARLRAEMDSLNREELERGIRLQEAYVAGLEFRIQKMGKASAANVAAQNTLAELNDELIHARNELQMLEKGMQGVEDREFDKLIDAMTEGAVLFVRALDDTAKATGELTDEQKKAAEQLKKLTEQNEDYVQTLRDELRQTDLVGRALAHDTALLKLNASATDEVRAEVLRLTDAIFERSEATRQQEEFEKLATDAVKEHMDAQRKLATEAERTAEKMQQAAEKSALESQRQWTATRDYLADSFINIANNGGSAFEQIGNAFSAMIQRMIAEWAAAKVMGWFGMSSPMGNSGPAATATGTIFNAGTNAVISKVAPSIAKTLGIGAAATTGIAAGTAVGGTAGVSTVYAAGTAATSAAGLTSTAIGTGAATTGAAGGITGTLAAVPVWGWVAAAALAAAAYLDKPTPSSNAGMLLHDVPGAKPDQKFSVDPFDSGLAPVGFSRRESQAEAIAVIDVFRQYDSALTGLAKTAGLSVNLDASTFRAIGLNEEGRGDGVFLGDAGQKDKPGKPLQDQLDDYVTAYVQSLQGQINPESYQQIISAGNADAMLAAATQIVSRIDGSHASGLDYVPFDGYRAELHRGERVQTASEARQSDNSGSAMLNEMRALAAGIRKVAESTKKTADLLARVTRDGESLLTEAA